MSNYSAYFTSEYLKDHRATKGAAAMALYPSELYDFDTALPQSWLDAAYSRGSDMRLPGGNIASHFVMVYPRNGETPFIGAVTMEGVQELGRLAATI